MLFDLGVFPRLVPEWAHLVGHTTHDVYHVWTTDRHLLEAWRRLFVLETAARDGEADEAVSVHPALRDAWRRLVDRGPTATEAVRIATLFHDVGKALGGDHSMIGAGMAAEVARRIGLPDEVCRVVRWLVREHLMLPRTSQRRDIADEYVVQACADEIQEPWHLDALTVLSWADMTSVAPSSNTEWKVALLLRLHDAIAAALAPGGAPRPSAWQRYVEHCEAVHDAPRRGARGLLDRFEPASLRPLEGEELGALIEALQRWDDGDHVAVVAASTPRASGTARGTLRLTVIMRDAEALLAEVAAAAAAAGLDIVSARIVTTRDGLAVDQFVVRFSTRARQTAVAQFEHLVRDAAAGRHTAASLRALRRDESTLRAGARPAVPTEIRLSPADFDQSMSILEIRTRDRIGLLADIAAFLAARGVVIERALVHVEGDGALDTFYVRGDRLEAIVPALRELLARDP